MEVISLGSMEVSPGQVWIQEYKAEQVFASQVKKKQAIMLTPKHWGTNRFLLNPLLRNRKS